MGLEFQLMNSLSQSEQRQGNRRAFRGSPTGGKGKKRIFKAVGWIKMFGTAKKFVRDRAIKIYDRKVLDAPRPIV